jgi:predicted nuclease with TOPRIM domain
MRPEAANRINELSRDNRGLLDQLKEAQAEVTKLRERQVLVDGFIKAWRNYMERCEKKIQIESDWIDVTEKWEEIKDD